MFLKALELSGHMSKSQKRTSRNIVHHTDKKQMSLVQEQLVDKTLSIQHQEWDPYPPSDSKPLRKKRNEYAEVEQPEAARCRPASNEEKVFEPLLASTQ
jgi:hypothetical protein